MNTILILVIIGVVGAVLGLLVYKNKITKEQALFLFNFIEDLISNQKHVYATGELKQLNVVAQIEEHMTQRGEDDPVSILVKKAIALPTKISGFSPKHSHIVTARPTKIGELVNKVYNVNKVVKKVNKFVPVLKVLKSFGKFF